jgi:hypothetical protein
MNNPDGRDSPTPGTCDRGCSPEYEDEVDLRRQDSCESPPPYDSLVHKMEDPPPSYNELIKKEPKIENSSNEKLS